MTTPPVRVERRAGQRFFYLLPVSLREQSGGPEGHGFTQDLSSRGVFFFTDVRLQEGSEIELTLNMPSEITLGESMRVRCRGRILRVVKRSDPGLPEVPADRESKIGVAVRFESYEYLADANLQVAFPRVASLHHHREEDSLVREPVPVPPLAN